MDAHAFLDASLPESSAVVIFSIGCEYAIRAMTYLAEHYSPGEFCLLRTVTGDHHLPQHFVGKIFQSLVRSGLLLSAKGRGGGFALQRPPSEIHLYEIVEAVDGSERLRRCVLGMERCEDHMGCPLHDQWKAIREQIEHMLRTTTLENMARNTDIRRVRAAEPVTAHVGMRMHG